MQLHVDAVEPRAGAPILMHFQNGYITEDFTKCNPSAVLLSGEGKTVVAADIGDTLYAGEESREELGKTLLLIKSHSTGKVRVVEAGTVLMRAVLSVEAQLGTEDTINALEVSRKFGSKKDKKLMEQREKLKVNTTTMNDQLKKVAETASEAIEKIDLKNYTKTDSEDFYIPPINRDADNVKDVYLITDILSVEQMEKIAEEVETKDWQTNLHSYVKTLTKEEMNASEIALVLLANSLLTLVLTMIKDITKKSFNPCEFSHTLNEFCFENFIQTVNGRRLRPNPLKDKTLCHLIVVVLLLNNFKFDLDDFANAVKISPATIILKSRAVGAHISTDKKNVILKLPLNTAKSFLSNRRKSSKF